MSQSKRARYMPEFQERVQERPIQVKDQPAHLAENLFIRSVSRNALRLVDKLLPQPKK